MSQSPSQPATNLPAKLVFLCAVLSTLVSSRALWETLQLAWSDDRYTHILLVLPILAMLIILRWSDLPNHALSNEGRRITVVVLLTCIYIPIAISHWKMFGHSESWIAFLVLVLVLHWIVSLILCLGLSGFRTLLFPALFSFWLVPLPAAVVDRIVTLLQIGSAQVSEVLFWTARVPVSREGILLYIPGYEIEVATECSSIRSSLILIVVTMLLAQLLLRSPWRKFIVMAAAIPLSIAKNGLRIFVISMLATHVDESYWTGSFHHHGGVVFLLIALAATIFLVWILRRSEARSV
jgi:exosortase